MEASKRAPKPQRERLSTLRNRGARARRRSVAAPVPTSCTNPDCRDPKIEESDNGRVCLTCGTLISESNIVADVTFGESSAGAAVVQGGFVGEGQRHAKSLGPAFRRAGATESREITEGFGRDEIRKQANALRLNVANQAFEVYKLAISNNFIQGRRIRTVAAVCLYIACRRDARNTTLLMDFAELIQVNVFKLGQVYQDLMKALWLQTTSSSGVRPVIEVEWLIEKYARKLEFGSSTMKVAEDAAKIVKRMKRDWMVTGRQPAGLCGACIILAARMNNFRRTVREVVYVVKVADMTISKRLEEFKRTASANLTVDQFREFGVRLKNQADPPAVYEAKARELKRKRQIEKRMYQNEPQIIEDGASRTSSRQASEAPIQALRRDADGFVIPNLPIDPNILAGAVNADQEAISSHLTSQSEADDQEATPAKRPRGRPKKIKPPRPPTPEITDADLIIEDELENEIERILVDPAALANMEETALAVHAERARALADTLRGPAAEVSGEPDIEEDEFADDPEVANCLLSEAERQIKERIWVTHNEDWLRGQQAKILKKALDEANGTAKKVKRRRRRGKMGDGSVLEGGTPVESPAEANQRMLERRGKGFSKHINYEKLSEYYKGFYGSSANGEATATRSESDAGSESANQLVAERRAAFDAAEATLASPAASRDRGEIDEEEIEDEDDDDDELEDEVHEDIRGTLNALGIDAGDFEGEEEEVGFDEDEGDER